MIATAKDTKKPVKLSMSACPWYQKVGFYGFMFFLIKGLLWLIIPVLLVYFGGPA